MSDEKFVDEAWKDAVVSDKSAGCSSDSCGCSKESCADHEDGCGCGGGQDSEIEVNFFTYLTSIGYQAMIFLGEIPNPMNGQNEKNLRQAKFIIDTILMLKEKTKGNLNEQENAFIDGTLYELQMKFVELLQKGEQV